MKYIVLNLDKVLVMVLVEISFTNTNDMRMQASNYLSYFWHFVLKKSITLIPMGNFNALVFPISILILRLGVCYHGEG